MKGITHGTFTAYLFHRCRCDICRKHVMEAHKEYRRKRIEIAAEYENRKLSMRKRLIKHRRCVGCMRKAASFITHYCRLCILEKQVSNGRA